MKGRRPIDWLWEPYIPRGCITTLAAKSGVGKSAFSLWLAAGFARSHGIKTYYVDLEQSLGHIAERLHDWNLMDVADYIGFPVDEDEKFGYESASPDFATITAEAIKFGAQMVIIDSMTSLYSKFDIERRAGASIVMRELRSIAVKADVGLLLLAHTNKASIDNLGQISVDNITGSAAIVDLSRSVLFLTQDENDERRKTLTHLKCNFRNLADPLVLEITPNGIVFLPEQKPRTVCGQSKMDMLMLIAENAINEGTTNKRDIRAAVKKAGASETEASRVWQRLLDDKKIVEEPLLCSSIKHRKEDQ